MQSVDLIVSEKSPRWGEVALQDEALAGEVVVDTALMLEALNASEQCPDLYLREDVIKIAEAFMRVVDRAQLPEAA